MGENNPFNLRTRPTPTSSVTPGFSAPVQQMLQEMQRTLNSFAAQLAPGNDAIGAQRATREDPVTIKKLLLDVDSTSAANEASGNPKVIEWNHAHQCLYFQDNNSRSAYFWYRPVSPAYESTTRWIKVRPGDRITWPYPVEKAYVWYPDQTLLTATVLLLRYGNVDTATLNTISLNAGSGSSLVTAAFGAAGTSPSVAVGNALAAAVSPPLATRTKAWIYNDAGGDIVWLGDSNVAENRGFPLAPGASMEWTNVGPLFAIAVAGGASTLYGMEERQ